MKSTVLRWSIALFALAPIGCMSEESPIGVSEEALLASSDVSIPGEVVATATADSCQNSPGPYVKLDGNISLGGLTGRFIFRNNQKGTHEHTEDLFTTDTVIIPQGESIVIPKQPSQGGSGGNPFIWIQFVDGDGNALSDEIFLGRCVQGFSSPNARLALPAMALVESATATDCTNNPGPFITVNAQLALSGLTVRWIFRNNDNPVSGPHETVVTKTADLVVIPKGQTIQFPKQPVLGGVGGNPWIYLQMLDGNGAAVGDEMLLGRCVQLQAKN